MRRASIAALVQNPKFSADRFGGILHDLRGVLREFCGLSLNRRDAEKLQRVIS
jgi:hypothetical protein